MAGATTTKPESMFKFDTDMPDLLAGAGAGALIGWTGVAGKGEKKIMNGAILGGLTVLVLPTIRGFVGKVMPPKA